MKRREAEALFRATFEQAAVGIAHVGLDGSWLRVNDKLCAIVGYTQSELAQLTFQDITDPEDLDADLHLLQQVLAGSLSTYSMHKRYVRKDKSRIWVELTVSLKHHRNGNPHHFISVVSDISERIKAQQALEQKARELESANEELRAFTYTVSHDLRAPLRAISGFAGVVAEDYGDVLDEDGIRLIRVIKEQAGKMGELIDDLLALSRLSRGELSPTEVRMDALAASAWRDVRRTVGVREAYFAPRNLPAVQGDAASLRQVWTNLIGNAVKYAREGEPICIDIEAHEQDGMWVFSVADNGIGFKPDYAQQIFQVFQRLHADEEYEGTGVGLAIVRRVIERHGGQAWAESKPGQGSTFFFSLPQTNPTKGTRCSTPLPESC